ncbi:MAG TPA: pyridoxal-phosphate dependent enzyme, partial [Candidatus Norongarragalinales archaeon]|nr:pyridoxal-phosphate dependent enzyme [Candidatus Norongarragalinales archaeon]
MMQNLIDAIGNTPLVRLSRIGKSLKAPMYAKVEYLNPAGSVKDRMALKMVLDAEKAGTLRPGMTIVEPTSGNTGAGLAMV